MNKILKRTAVLLAVALAVVCLGIFASACGGAKEYTVTVYYSDGKTVVDGSEDGLTVQICDASGKFCYTETPKVDEKGVAKFDIADVDAKAEKLGIKDKKYLVHVWDGNDELDLKDGKVTVDAKNASVKVVLADREAK